MVSLPESQTSIRESIERCDPASTADIASQLSAFSLDDVTRELMVMCVERAEPSLFRTFPLAIRHTMYGDDGIADWTLRYSEEARSVEPADDDEVVDAHVRWERWEDCVRLIHGKANGTALFAAQRATALGEAGFRSNGTWWFMGTNFTNDADMNSPGRLMAYLRTKVNNEAALDAFVEEIGLDKLMGARAHTIAETMSDLQAIELLAGSWLRWEIEGMEKVAQLDIDADLSWHVRVLDRADCDDQDTNGVRTLFTSPKAFLYMVGGRETLTAQMVSGDAKLVGPDDRLKAFSAAMRRMVSPAAME